MNKTIPALAASESKSTFMTALGLKTGNQADERLYKLMKEEAVEEYKRVVQTRRAMSPDGDHDDPNRPRYAYTQIDKAIINKAILSIYHHSSPETRAIYDRGKDMQGDNESNWIVRWMLYHCFRYRDGRNKRSPSVTINGDWIDGGRAIMSDPPVTLISEESTASASSNDSEQSAATDHTPTNSSKPPRGLPYDPVRP